MGVGGLGCRFYFVLRSILLPITNVLRYRSGKQHWLLADNSDVLPQPPNVQLSYIITAYQNLQTSWMILSWQYY